MVGKRYIFVLLGALLLTSSNAFAHKMRSVLLVVTEQPSSDAGQTSNEAVVELKSSLNKQGRPAPVTVRFDPPCLPTSSPIAERLDDAVLRRYTVICNSGLTNRRLHLDGLDPTTPDAFVEIRFADGSMERHGLSRNNSSTAIGSTQHNQEKRPSSLWPYFGIGIEHIIFGIDHLLFVLGLLLLMRKTGAASITLITTITAFTLAHSITLGLAVIGGVNLPSAPVEIVIALSVLLLASEIHQYNGWQRDGLPQTLTTSKPWLVAFGFGLLHGFGFAGALSEIGVPDEAAMGVLLLFNLGVEFGQLIFVALVVPLLIALEKSTRLIATVEAAMVNAIGGLAMFWVIDRSLPILGF